MWNLRCWMDKFGLNGVEFASASEEHGEQLVDILHNQVNDNTCLRISDKRFSISRRETPSYSKLLAISNTYGYTVAGTPSADAQDTLLKGTSKGTNTAIKLDARKEIDLASYGKPTHVDISADELSVVVATISGKVLVFSATLLVGKGVSTPEKVISVGGELRDLRANPLEAPTTVAALTLPGDLLMLDITTGSCETVVASSDYECITCICWSRKGKQIVCGDISGKLTRRTPTDGAAKRIIEPQEEDGNILDEFSVLAVDWIDTYTFFVVYGVFPDGGLKPGNGGGGTGNNEDGEDDGIEDNMTAAYVITQDNKKAPMEWKYIEDPCSSMMCPQRYAGFHIACISNWGESARNIIIMAGTSSDATMTIGEAATSESPDGGSGIDESSICWAQWDIDGSMAVMPLSAVTSNDDTSTDAFPIGIAIDYTSNKDLPPVSDDGERVGPVPILWILNTDACLLAYHIYNIYEMCNGGSSSNMVKNIKQLPSTASNPDSQSPLLAPTTAPPRAFGPIASPGSSKLPTFSLGGGAFGSASSSGFGKFGSLASTVKAPSATGVTGQPVFGSGSKIGSSNGGTTGFGGFGQTPLGSGKSIFDAPSQGPSIFDSPAKEGGLSIFDAPAKGQSIFGQPQKNPSASPAPAAKPTGSIASAISTKFKETTPTSVSFGSAAGFGTAKPTAASTKPFDATSRSAASGTSSFGSSFGAFSNKNVASGTNLDRDNAASYSNQDSKFGNANSSAQLGQRLETQRFEDAKKTRALQEEQKKREEAERLQMLEKRKEEERQEAERFKAIEKRKEEEKQEAMRRELEEKTGELVRKQYILTCNKFDSDLKAFAAAIKQTEFSIAQVRSARLPPINIDPSVQQLASLTGRMDALSIEDTDAWNSVADVLLEALQVSRDELQTSQKTVAKQMSSQLRMETKREEINRILETAASALALPNATVDGGLNPLQRDYQRRLKRAYDLIDKRIKDVEQVVGLEADRLESVYNNLPKSLRAPTIDSIQRTLLNVSNTLDQKNQELDKLTARIEAMGLDKSSEKSSLARKQRTKRTPPIFSVLSPSDSVAKNNVASDGSPVAATGATATNFRTAASGIPWSPDNLPFSIPKTGRHNRGFGLRFEDLMVSGKSSAKTPGAFNMQEDKLGLSNSSPLQDKSDSPTKSNPLFPSAQVRELVPRSTKSLRKTSIVLDNDTGVHAFAADDNASVSTTSTFSNAAAYIQVRKQRTLVRDVLTRSKRSASVFGAPESAASTTYKFGNTTPSLAVSNQTPMPNLERYVKAFGKLKIAEPEPEPEAASASGISEGISAHAFSGTAGAAKPTGFGNMSKQAEEAKPTTSNFGSFVPVSGLSLRTASSASVASPITTTTTMNTVSGIFGGLKSSGSLAFGSPNMPTPDSSAAAAKTGTRTIFGFGEPKPSSEKASDEWTCSVCELKSPNSAVKCTVCDAPKPGEEPAQQIAASITSTDFGRFVPSGSRTFGAPSASAPGKSTATSKDSFKPAFGFGSFTAPAVQPEEWTCAVCELKSPGNAIKCTVCDAPKPGEKPAKPPVASTTSTFGGFKPSGGISFGSQASTPATSIVVSIASSDSPKPAQTSSISTFGSFASAGSSGFKPSGGISFGLSMKAALNTPASKVESSSKPMFGSGGFEAAVAKSSEWACEVCELKSPSSATKCTVCDAPKPEEKHTQHTATSALSGFGAFKPSAGLSLGSPPSLSHAEGQSVLSTLKSEPASAAEKFASEAEESGSATSSDVDNASEVGSLEEHLSEYSEEGIGSEDYEHSEDVSDRSDNEDNEKADNISQTYADIVKVGVSEDDEAKAGVESLDSDNEHTHSTAAAGSGGEKEDNKETDQKEAEAAMKKYEQAAHTEAASTYDVQSTSEARDQDVAVDELVSHGEPEYGEEHGNEREEQEHDSDGFVHVSQLESGNKSTEDVSQKEPATSILSSEKARSETSETSDPNMVNKEAEIIENTPGADASVERDASTVSSGVGMQDNVPSHIVDEIRQQLEGTAADKLVDCVFSSIVNSTAVAISADAPSKDQIETVPEDTKEEESQLLDTRTSEEFVMLSQSDSIVDIAPSPDSKSDSNSNNELTFDLGELATGIDTVSTADVVSDDGSELSNTGSGLSIKSPISISQSYFTGKKEASATTPPSGSVQSLLEEPLPVEETKQPEASQSDSKSSFFKAGKLGKFGAFGNKGIFGSSQTASFASSGPAGNSGLPKAFSGVAQKSSTPAFGSKLDRPAFGVASMSSYESNKRVSSRSGSSSSLASMNKLASGFDARGSSNVDPFAAYRKANSASPVAIRQGDNESIFSQRSREYSPRPFVDLDTTAFSKISAAAAPKKTPDPLRNSIEDDGFGAGENSSDDNDYDSD
ncbi:hypothetical protein EDC05_000780 [Coemansia umbellata]|uniref:RanBP2-type domain-containing protein n=1 Tax=Coemansia umbellata TaxID=1424467 RepID=A0ABQ8PTK1_9FUNG|nr:hypothetical protein EDC05_000780 [Coemansia umbellata]